MQGGVLVFRRRFVSRVTEGLVWMPRSASCSGDRGVYLAPPSGGCLVGSGSGPEGLAEPFSPGFRVSGVQLPLPATSEGLCRPGR